MTPKEKAKELVQKMYPHWRAEKNRELEHYAKHCAFMAVYEILGLSDNKMIERGYVSMSEEYKYWQEVKQEIDKL